MKHKKKKTIKYKSTYIFYSMINNWIDFIVVVIM